MIGSRKCLGDWTIHRVAMRLGVQRSFDARVSQRGFTCIYRLFPTLFSRRRHEVGIGAAVLKVHCGLTQKCFYRVDILVAKHGK